MCIRDRAILCVTGVGCVAYAGIGEFSLRFGDFITLASALWLSFHVLYTAKYAPGRSMMLLTVIQFIVAGLLGLITGLITEPVPNFSQLGADTWMSLIYITVFASCVAVSYTHLDVYKRQPICSWGLAQNPSRLFEPRDNPTAAQPQARRAPKKVPIA